MTTTELQRVIVDTDSAGDPRILKAADILTAEGRGFLAWTGVDIVQDGVKRMVIEVNLAADRAVIVDAVRRAGLTVIENHEIDEPIGNLASPPPTNWDAFEKHAAAMKAAFERDFAFKEPLKNIFSAALCTFWLQIAHRSSTYQT